MKKIIAIPFIIVFAIIALIIGFSCKKKTDPAPEETPAPTTSVDNYTSLQDFYNKNGVQLQTFTLNAISGGTFVSNKSTTIGIPANAFVDLSNNPVTGNVTIQFKDIYKKSDMLFSNAPTETYSGPLKSAGEFCIKALSGSNPLNIATGKKLTIELPVQPLAVADFSMTPFIANDTAGFPKAWYPSPTDQLYVNSSTYVFDMFSFNSVSATSGSWCNSDNQNYFNAYPLTSLCAVKTGTFTGYIDLFLIFKSVNSMVHVYQSGPVSYTDYYAPTGLPCSLVAVGISGGKLFSSINSLTISTTQTVNFSMTETNTTDFQNAVKALN